MVALTEATISVIGGVIVASVSVGGVIGAALINARTQKKPVVTAEERSISDLKAELAEVTAERDVWRRLALEHMPPAPDEEDPT